MKSFIVQQKITPFVNRYEVYENVDGSKGAMISFVQQKRLAFKEEIQFYTDSSKQELLCRVKAEKVMDIHGRFMVTDAAGSTIGWARKVFKASLLRSTWQLSNTEQQLTVTEKSESMAILRRVWGFVPIISEFPFVFRYHFVFNNDAGVAIAEYSKTTRFRDHYRFTVNDEVIDQFDQRLLIAQCVLLDALQAR